MDKLANGGDRKTYGNVYLNYNDFEDLSDIRNNQILYMRCDIFAKDLFLSNN